MGLRLAVAALLTTLPAQGYDADHHIESARLYGDVGSFAYYFVDLLIGTPKPQRTSVIVDTGSSICAFPCTGCRHCGKHLDSLFDVSKSRSARWVGCGSVNSCPKCFHGRCGYSQSYTEGSSVSGGFFDDFVELGDELQQNPPVRARMGCHSQETRLFYTQKANGIFGMAPSSRGKVTILDDLFRDKAHINRAIFAMCLAEHGGALSVGGYNETLHRAGTTVLWVPMTLRGSYQVRLKSISVKGEGTKMLRSDFGSTMVDSGTTYTYFPTALYRELRDAVSSSCRQRKICRPVAATGGTCWSIASREHLADFPDLHVGFHAGGDMVWRPQSYMYQKGGHGSLWCFGFEDNGHQHETVLGATWMLNMNVIFDLESKRLGLAEADCPEFQKRPPPPSGSIRVSGVPKHLASELPTISFSVGSPFLFGLTLTCLAVTGLLRMVHNLQVAVERARRQWSAEVEAATTASKLPRRNRRLPRATFVPGPHAVDSGQAEGGVAEVGGTTGATNGRRGRSRPAIPLHVWLRRNRDEDVDSGDDGEFSRSGCDGGSSEIEVACSSQDPRDLAVRIGS